MTTRPPQLHALHHVNIQTTDCPRLAKFYTAVLGLKAGPRPPVRSPGVWLYLDDIPLLHLNERDHEPSATNTRPGIHHFALTASGLDHFLRHLREHKVAYHVQVVPKLQTRLVKLTDPDGNHLEILFNPRETADLAPSRPE